MLAAIATVLVMGIFVGAAQALPVANLAVDNSSPTTAAGGRTDYVITFNTSQSGGLSAGNTITLTFPSGSSTVTIANGTVTDVTAANTVVGGCGENTPTIETCSINSGKTVAAGDQLRIELDGATNTTTVSPSNTLTVSTTSDSTNATAAYATITPAAITGLSVDNTSPTTAAGGRTVYVATFSTSTTGGAMSGTARSQITLTFPSGSSTVTIANGTVTDVTAANTVVGGCGENTPTIETCSINSGKTVAAGDQLRIELDGATNTTTVSPSNTLTVSTTSDSTNATAAYATITPAAITGLSVDNTSPTTAAAGRTVYVATFSTSTTGGAMSGTARSQITLTFPSGSSTVTIANGTVTDVTAANTVVGGCGENTPTIETCSINSGKTVAAGDQLRIELDGATNTTTVSPSNTLTVSTTSDSTNATAAYATITPAAITGLSVDNTSPTTAAAGRTVYVATFSTSTTGGAMSGTARSQITLTFPSGSSTVTIANGTVTDVTAANTVVGGCGENTPTIETCSINSGKTVAAGDQLRIELDGATNTTTVSPSNTLTVSTTSDTTNATAAYATITPAGVSQPTVRLSNLSPSASANYVIAFATSTPGGGMLGTARSQITLTFPSGSSTVTIRNGTVTDASTGIVVGGCGENTPTIETCSINSGKTVAAGDQLRIELDGVTNPSNVSTSSTLSVQTTSDTTRVTSGPYQGGGPQPPAVTSISPTSGSAAGGTTVTINGSNFTNATAVAFGPNTATSFSVNSDTQITAISPAGSGAVDVTVTSLAGTSATGAPDRFTYNAPAPPPPPSSPPGVSGGAPTSKSSSGTAVSGSVNPESLTTTAFFQYGLDPAYRGPGASTTLYDQSTPVQQVGADSTTHTVTAPLSGLVPGALYHVRLVATNSAGTTFGVDQTFTTAAAPAPPPPVLGQTETAQPVTGTVFIRLPSGAFVKLTGAQQIPSGAQIDALHGSLQITTAAAQKGKTQQGVFGGAVFKLTQARAGATKGLATLTLLEAAFKGAPTYATCKKAKAGDASAAAASSKVLQLLHASAKGKFKTSGRYAAATVRGTKWTIADRCDGTLTHDVTDSVAVTDFVRHKTIILHAGQSYLAKATKHAK